MSSAISDMLSCCCNCLGFLMSTSRRIIDDGVSHHYAATNVLGCPGAQYSNWPVSMLIAPRCCGGLGGVCMGLLVVFRLLLMFILGVVCLACAIPIAAACCPFSILYLSISNSECSTNECMEQPGSSCLKLLFEILLFSFYAGLGFSLLVLLIPLLLLDLCLLPFRVTMFLCTHNCPYGCGDLCEFVLEGSATATLTEMLFQSIFGDGD